MRKWAFLSLLLLLILLTSCSIAMPAHADLTWTIQTVDPNTPFGVGTIAVDSNNNPHIAYTHREGKNDVSFAMYAGWNGSNWSIKKITEGTVLDLKLDSNNTPYVLIQAHNDAGEYPLEYAMLTGTEWHIQTVTKDWVSQDASLALDSKGNPQVAFKRYIDGGTPANIATLKYASLVGSNASIQTVDAPISYSDPVHLALDSNDNPHITYGVDNPGDGTGSTLKYAMLNASGWNSQTVFSDLLDYGNMVLDSNDYPHFTCVRNDPVHDLFNILTYASWNGSNWNTQIVDSNISDVGSRAYLALDSHDNPNIDYITPNQNGDSDHLMYARWTGTEWDTQIVGPNSTAYEEGPIAIDSNGNPHITYAGTPVSPYHATCMYATTTIEPTQTATPSATPTLTVEPLWIAIPILTAITVATLVYIWKIGKKQATNTNSE